MGGIMMYEVIKKALNLGFGALYVTKETVELFVDEMVKKGEIKKEEAKVQVDELLKKIHAGKKDVESKIEEVVKAVLHKLDIPTRRELLEMQKKLEEIIQKIDSRKD